MDREVMELTVQEIEDLGYIIVSDIPGLKDSDKPLEFAEDKGGAVVTDETAGEGEVDIFIVSWETAEEMNKAYSEYFVW